MYHGYGILGFLHVNVWNEVTLSCASIEHYSDDLWSVYNSSSLSFILVSVSNKCPWFCKCLIFSKSGFPNFQILLAEKSDQHPQQATGGA